MLLINSEINLMLTWSGNCVIYEAGKATTFSITDAKLYVSVETLSTGDNTKLLDQSSWNQGSRKLNWNTYQSKVLTWPQNQY